MHEETKHKKFNEINIFHKKKKDEIEFPLTYINNFETLTKVRTKNIK